VADVNLEAVKKPETFYRLYGTLFSKLKDDPEIGPEVLESDIVVTFTLADIDLRLTVDMTRKTWSGPYPRAGDGRIIQGPPEGGAAPDVEIVLTVPMMHRLWEGSINLMVALQQRELQLKGPIPKITRLLPLLAPAYEVYPAILAELGLA